MIKGYSTNAEKIFCIGQNKTGTTSVDAALCILGYRVAPQGPAEMLLHKWSRRDFKKLKRMCLRYDAFQDVPFSFPFTFQEMDQTFPNSKFILTVRDSSDEWFSSFTRFHMKGTKTEGIPKIADVKAHEYRYRGYLWDCHRLYYGVSEEQLYDPGIYKEQYERHNASVSDYFRWRPEKLLVLNVKENDAFQKLSKFLGRDVSADAQFPWENRT